MSADKTAEKQRGRPFRPGESGNPKGRPIGARQRLGTELLEALEADFAEHGAAVIARVRAERPHEYLKLIASLLPRTLNLNTDPAEEMTDDELDDQIRAVARALNLYLVEADDGRGDNPQLH